MTVAVPKMNKQVMAAHEMAAIRQVGTIHQAETQYYSQYGRYAANLAELGPPASGAASPASADLIPKVLADGKNSGYLFTVTASPTGYSVTAIPEASCRSATAISISSTRSCEGWAGSRN